MNHQTAAVHTARPHVALPCSTFAVDAQDRVAQRVLPTASIAPNTRFYVVLAHGAKEAIELGVAARAAGCCTIADYKAKVALSGQAL